MRWRDRLLWNKQAEDEKKQNKTKQIRKPNEGGKQGEESEGGGQLGGLREDGRKDEKDEGGEGGGGRKKDSR